MKTMGLDPATGALITSLAQPFLTSFFSPGSGPAPAQPSAAALELIARREREASERQTRTLLIAGGIVALGLGAFFLISRK